MYAWYAQNPSRPTELVERFESLDEALTEILDGTCEEDSIFCTDLVIDTENGTPVAFVHRGIYNGEPKLVVTVKGYPHSREVPIPDIYKSQGFKFDQSINF